MYTYAPPLVLQPPAHKPVTPGPATFHLDTPCSNTATADFTVVNYVFRTLFLSNPDTIDDLKAALIVDLRSILDADPLFYLANGVIYDAKKNSWELFVKLAMVAGWTNDTDVFSFTEDNWDATNKILFPPS